MALPNVVIIINRSGLGQVVFTDDSIMGLVLPGVSIEGGLQTGEAQAIYSLADAENLGITETSANAAAWKQIKEFYDEAGTGSKVWFILSGENLMSANVGGTANAVRTLVETAKGEISLVGLCRGLQQSDVVVDGLNEDVAAAMQASQVLADEYQSLIMPFSVVIEGVGFSGNENTVVDLHTKTQHRCSVILCASGSDGIASVGQYIGRLAAIPVQRKPSRVKDGALTNLNAYLTDGEGIDNRIGALNVLHDKGYIVYRSFPGKSGYYYSGDPTATSATDDLNTIARNRIIDKVLKISYNVYTGELDEDVPVTESGTLEPAVCAYLQTIIEQQVNGNMSDEISSFTAYVDPNQNILSGQPLKVVLTIIPKGYLSEIQVTIGFSNPYANN
jgi:hypothetical protein